MSGPPYGMGSSDPRLPMNRSHKTVDLKMTDAQVKHMIDRFLGWKLPDNFSPDGGVSFKRLQKPSHANGAQGPYPMPSGTNLFDATQTDAMVRYMLEGLPVDAPPLCVTCNGTKKVAAANPSNAKAWQVQCPDCAETSEDEPANEYVRDNGQFGVGA